eukprot:CAMPEP_0174311324 /NCGR_PEP_ID=MMETSP0810-20121108/3647_1 /TAXON_ID=73025 ORGANISM="Eutreptiella gymnastica-like, Strain CCMP1594" /NCGR_SAMPLE_ID=MMETSP0810 /ASSEMBLY_ACC=CAM_ASM_000659 /LENGTH=1186 /DNA_ID=CAMNT_0015419545 /DNA_START=23 /DNA_END=3583 /DNA_ORIENTATION=-
MNLQTANMAAATFFQKNLADLVKGIRGHKKNEKEYIQKCLNEIKEEFKSSDCRVKCIAVQKCTYLAMLGYDMEWAAFHVVEVMADQNFQHKRIGYLAAAQSFTPNTDVIALTTNLFKKEMSSNNQFETGMALNCLSNVCTTDLARDLVSDVIALLASSRAYIRKKGVLVMFKIFLQFPDALRPSFPRLKEKLDDSDPSVVAAAVNTICELARKNPGNYLGMAPTFFKLLTSIQNNWTLIKIVKLFGSLTPLEPRLAKKLVDPLTNIINTTPAKSLLYECLNTVSHGMAKQTGILKLSLDKLKMFVEDRDQNLRYLGLLGLHHVMMHNSKLVADMRETVVECLNGEDITIRYRALELIVGMVNKKNIQGIVGKLCEHVLRNEGDYKHELITKIIETCSQSNFEYISNFEWYLRVLMDLVQCEIKNVRHGKQLGDQFMDVIIRVKAIRDFGIRCMCTILASSDILMESLDIERSNMYEVLSAAAWLCGEFCDRVKDPKTLMENLVQPSIKGLPGRTQAIFVQAAMKVYTFLVGRLDEGMPRPDKAARVRTIAGVAKEGLKQFSSSGDVEVQERATQSLKLIDMHLDNINSVDLAPQLKLLFEEEMLPVGAGAQKKVPVPAELDLETDICHYESSSEEEAEEESDDSGGEYGQGGASEAWNYQKLAAQFATKAGGAVHGAGNTYILKEDFSKKAAMLLKQAEEDLPPMRQLQARSAFDDLGVRGYYETKVHTRKKKGRGGRRGDSSDDDAPAVMQVVDLPEGASLSDEEREKRKNKKKSGQSVLMQHTDPNSIDARLNMDLSGPLRADEALPEVKAYLRQEASPKQDASMLLQQMTRDRKKDKEDKKKDKKEKDKKDKKDKKSKEPEPAGPVKWHERGRVEPEPRTSHEKEKKKKDKGEKEKKSKDKDRLKDKEEKKEKDKKSKSSKDEKPAPSPSPSPGGGRSGARAPSGTALACGGGDKVLVWYEPDETAFKDSNNMEIALHVQNKMSAPVTVMSCDWDQTLNLKVGPGTALPMGVLAGTCGTLTVPLCSKDIVRAQMVDGRLQCQGEAGTVQVRVPVPCSLWMKDEKLTAQEFQEILQNAKLSGRSKTMQIPPEMDVRKALQTISHLLRVKLVGIVDSVASLYGRSCQGHHVCVVVKALSDWEISVELKCTDGVLCSSLLQEVQEEFKLEAKAAGGNADELDFLSM